MPPRQLVLSTEKPRCADPEVCVLPQACTASQVAGSCVFVRSGHVWESNSKEEKALKVGRRAGRGHSVSVTMSVKEGC